MRCDAGGRSCAFLVGDPGQERNDDGAGEKRGSPVRHEGEGDTGDREEAEDPCDDQERLQSDEDREAGSEVLAEPITTIEERCRNPRSRTGRIR